MGLAGLGVDDEGMAAAAVVPGVPVADHQAVVGLDLGLRLGLFLEFLRRLLGRHAGINAGDDGQVIAGRRPDRAGNVDW